MFRLDRLFILLVFLAVMLTMPRWLLALYYNQEISDSEEAPAGAIAIVFGAGLRRDGQPTIVLADRVKTAVDLYRDGKVAKLLMSGSAHGELYDEAGAMRDYALSLGVRTDDILVDPQGDRTFLTCLRARDEFGVNSALLVSQRYHLPRALALCKTLGIDAVGVSSDLRSYRAQTFWSFRESIATLRALWDAGSYRFNTAITLSDLLKS
jgi:SanA protein